MQLTDVEFVSPGPLREQLIASVARGEKTATSALLAQYLVAGEPLPRVGSRGRVVGSDGEPRFVIEIVGVDVVRLGAVPLAHALAEGEGYDSVAAWRAAHEWYWTSAEMREELGEEVTIDDDTLVVLERFAVVDGADAASDPVGDDHASIVEQLRALEPIFHRAEPGATRATFERMTTDAYWEVGASGRVYGRDLVLDTVAARYRDGVVDDPWQVDEFAARQLDGDVWFVTYLLDQAGRRSRRATIWRRADGAWRAEYHQGTLV